MCEISASLMELFFLFSFVFRAIEKKKRQWEAVGHVCILNIHVSCVKIVVV